jgi:hypothetical protein
LTGSNELESEAESTTYIKAEGARESVEGLAVVCDTVPVGGPVPK